MKNNRQFDRKRQILTLESSCEALRPHCAGWIAKYEIWTTEIKPIKTQEFLIPLDVSEIWLQLRQSFRQEIGDVWRMQFPLAICDDLSYISILRTIYFFPLIENKLMDSYRLALLPMDFERSLSLNWSDERLGFGPYQDCGVSRPAGFKLVSHQLYEYRIIIDSKNALIIFRDNNQMTQRSVLAVFQIQVSPENFGISKVQHMMTDGRIIGSGHVALHPSMPILAFDTCFSINLWLFQSSKFAQN